MNVNELILELQTMQREGKGEYIIKSQFIDFNEANGGDYYIQQDQDIYSVNISDVNKSVTFGEYRESFSY